MDAAIAAGVFYNCYTAFPRGFRFVFASILAFAGSLSATVASQSVTLAWDPNPEPDIVAYRLIYGTTSGQYSQSIDVGNVTTVTVPNVVEGTTYFFAVTAINSSAMESAPSAEVSFTAEAHNAPPSVTITSPSDGNSVVAPANVTLNATASDSDGTISRLEFYNGTTKVGESTTNPTSFVVSLTQPGSYSLTARAVDNDGASSDSNPVAVTVTPPLLIRSPEITTVQFQTSTGVQLTVVGTAGQSMSVYVSNDLKIWSPLTTSSNTTGTFTVNDWTAATLNQRFYRTTDGTTTSEAVGFTKLQIAGVTGSKNSVLSYPGINMVNPTSYKGTITSTGTESIVDASATWNDGQFDGASGKYYLEIISGPWAGLTTDIISTNGVTKSLVLDDDLSTFLAGGEQYRVRKHRTIGDVFGPNNGAGLKAGTALSSSDEVRLFNPITQGFLSYYYNSASQGWRSGTNAVSDAAGTPLYLEQGLVISRKAKGTITLVLTGAVKTGPTLIPIGANSNLCANMYPAGTVTLGNSGLYTGNSTSGLVGAGKVSNADEVQIWNGTTLRRYFYKTGSGGTGWRLSSNLKSDASSTQIRNGSSIYVIRKNGRPAFNWKIQQPF